MILSHLFDFLYLCFHWINAATQYVPLAIGVQISGVLFLIFLVWFIGRLCRI